MNTNNLYDLWKYFSDDAAKVKDKLWTISIWFFAMMGSILGVIINYVDADQQLFIQPLLVLTISAVGILLSTYTYYLITSYGYHIRTSWNRTDYLRRQIPELDEIWKQGYANYAGPEPNKTNPGNTQKMINISEEMSYKKSDSIPSFVVRIRRMATAFIVIFSISAALAFIQLIF